MAPGPGWFDFDAHLELLPWGRNTYTILRLDPGLVDAAKLAKTRRIEGRIDEVEVNLGINRADVIPDAFAYVGEPLKRQLGATAGSAVSCRLHPADPNLVIVPDDVEQALSQAGCADRFATLSAAERRRLLRPIGSAKSDATRQRRIDTLITTLKV